MSVRSSEAYKKLTHTLAITLKLNEKLTMHFACPFILLKSFYFGTNIFEKKFKVLLKSPTVSK